MASGPTKLGRVSLDAVIKELMKDSSLSPETKDDLRRWLRKAKREITKGKQ